MTFNYSGADPLFEICSCCLQTKLNVVKNHTLATGTDNSQIHDEQINS